MASVKNLYMMSWIPNKTSLHHFFNSTCGRTELYLSDLHMSPNRDSKNYHAKSLQ